MIRRVPPVVAGKSLIMSEPTPLAIKADALCPFCGGQAELHKQLRGGHEPDGAEAYAYFYICASCACIGGWGKSEGTARRMWNMRSYRPTKGQDHG